MENAVTSILEPGLGTILDVDCFERLAALNIQKHTLPDGRIYACLRLGKETGYRRVYLHRYLLRCKPTEKGDHCNGNPLDNRMENLRPATQQQNTCNSKKRAHSQQPYKGIKKTRGAKTWVARIRVNGQMIYSCGHATPEDAARAYDALARIYHGAFALTNWPEREP